VDEEVTNDPEVVDDVGNVTDDVIDAIEDSINSEDNATIGAIENITEEVIEVIENATENVDNSTTEVAIQNALVRLLTNLVSAQDYNQNLAQEDKDELKANLEDAIEELASNAADSLR
jgi:poly-gamma-glutamate capsule biosynthesis protein CapA/YwtB (metallophosphatase superfamily)